MRGLRRPHLATLLIACLCATACGGAAGGESAMTADDPIDFTGPPPLVGAHEVGSPGVASGMLPFAVVAPASLGTPTVHVSNPPTEVGLVYNDATLGTYWVEQRVSNWTPRNLADLASCASVDAGCGDPAWARITLAGGTPAIEIGGPPGTAVIFLHDGVRFDVLGPPGAFSERDGVAVATEIEATFRGPAARETTD